MRSAYHLEVLYYVFIYAISNDFPTQSLPYNCSDAFLAFMLIIVVRLIEWKKNDKCKTIYAIWKPALIAGIAVVIGVYSIVIAKDQAKDRIIKSNRTLQIEQYAIENPENFYIYDTSLTFRYLPFTTYTDEYPSNLMFWGGMEIECTCFF